jgi:hypothetical protein
MKRLVLSICMLVSGLLAAAAPVHAQKVTFHDPDEGLKADIRTVVVAHTSTSLNVAVVLAPGSGAIFNHLSIDTNATHPGPEFIVQTSPPRDVFISRSRGWGGVGRSVPCPGIHATTTTGPPTNHITVPRTCIANGRGVKPPRVRINIEGVSCPSTDYAPARHRFYPWISSGHARATGGQAVTAHELTVDRLGC